MHLRFIFIKMLRGKTTLIFLGTLFVVFQTIAVVAQQAKIYGTVIDSIENLSLPGAKISCNSSLVTTNASGGFELLASLGSQEILIEREGYLPVVVKLQISSDIKIDIRLTRKSIEVKGVTVTARSGSRNVTSLNTGTMEISKKEVSSLPLLMGESDFYKAIQLMPGVQSTGEGNAAIYVRGGGYDQNLILLDEATVYNPSHLLGFYSVFNTAAIDEALMIKSGMPAEYGNRISSVLKFTTRKNIPETTKVTGNLGLLSTNLSVEAPIFNQKGALFLAGRKTYLNTILAGSRKANLIGNHSILHSSGYDFYDLNASIVLAPSTKDRISLSTYTGNDLFEIRAGAVELEVNMDWGNRIGSLNWNHIFNPNLYIDNTLVYSGYSMEMSLNQNQYSFNLNSGIADIGYKNRFTWIAGSHKFRFGLAAIKHTVMPNSSKAKSNDLQLKLGSPNSYHSNEFSVFCSDEYQINSRLSMVGGLRYNRFYHLGPFNEYIIGNERTVEDTISYSHGEIIKMYDALDIRFSTRFLLTESNSLKLSYNSNSQFIHLVNASSISFPTDFWIPSSKIIQPQKGMQWAFGYYHNINSWQIETSAEVYYKSFTHQIEFNNGIFTAIDNTPLDNNLIFGKGRAYGLEFFIRKPKGKLNGWVSYSLSKTEKRFTEIEQNRWFPAKYDRPHDLSIVTNYDLNSHWSFSAVFEFSTGSTYTPVVGRYFVANNLVNQYGHYNSARVPAYHRLDISATLKLAKIKKVDSKLNISVYNIYNRHNPFFVYPEAKGNIDRYQFSVQPREVSIFPILPSISWQFSF